MFKRLTTYFYVRVVKISDKLLCAPRRNVLNNKDFSIICNNCWAGYVYRRFGIPYLTPTVGLYFFPEDYIKLCSDIKGYMEKHLDFISYTESKYKDIIESRKQTNVPIARLGDIEVVFLHYATEEDAAEKWYRRVKRINYDNLIFKFSKMNYCTDEHLKQFDKFDFKKKICFVPFGCSVDIKCGIVFKSSREENVNNDTDEYSRYISLRKLINSKIVCGKYMECK